MDRDAFDALVVEALDSLPDEFARHMVNVQEELAAARLRRHRRAVGIKPWQRLYGLYEGVPLTQRVGGDPLLPDLITIFQEPLEQDFPGREALRAQIRRTILHEIAHFFGIDDARLHELGAY